jgi:hypothetical protein
MHCREVEDDQDVVPHGAITSCTVEEYVSLAAKCRPLTVTELPPVSGPFKCAYDTTGPSKEKDSNPVPATAPTVNETVLVDIVGLVGDVQTAVVAELQAEVRQEA